LCCFYLIYFRIKREKRGGGGGGGGGELFDKRFTQRLDKNEVLSTITEEEIKEAKQSKQLKLFAKNNR